MPLVTSCYKPPLLFKSGHLSTIYNGIFRKVSGLVQKRERLELPDGDFLDLDWSYPIGTTRRAVVLFHGLEGDAQRPYITGSAKLFNVMGFDVCAVNLRGCSGEDNRLFRSYHSGATEDVDAVVRHILEARKYDALFLKGFSLGGNLILKYMGEGNPVPKEIKAVVGISVPCDLYSSLRELLRPKNILYAQRFKRHLVNKLILKQKSFPEEIAELEIKKIKNLKDFDDIYTSRANGFQGALDYYRQCSCLQFLPNIQVPTLIINAKNDSFLGPECYPIKEAEQNPFLNLEIPDYGGHVGFYGVQDGTYSEKRALKFMVKEV